MKWPVIIGGIVLSGAVAAGFYYGDSSDASPDGSTASVKKANAAISTQVAGMASPVGIISSTFNSAEEVAQAFEKQGPALVKGNLLSFDSEKQEDCPGRGSRSPSRTLYIRHVTEYPGNERGQATLPYTNVKVPVAGGGEFRYQTPNITEKVIRDDFEWKRRYQTRWSYGIDQEWLAEMHAQQQVLDEQFMVAQDESPEQAMGIARQISAIQMAIRENPSRDLNAVVDDIVEVEAPHTAWSFKYNNHTKKGDRLYRREAKPDYEAHSARLLENAEELIGILDPIRQFGENIELGGTRTILGYECTVKRAGGWDAEACMTEINGESVSLWTRIDKAESTAVYIDASPCVSLAQFMPPSDVQFDDKW